MIKCIVGFMFKRCLIHRVYASEDKRDLGACLSQGFVLLSVLVIVMVIVGVMLWFYQRESFALSYLRAASCIFGISAGCD